MEGGYFRRSYCSDRSIDSEPDAGVSDEKHSRPLLSSIYYMLTDDSPIGYFHRNQSDIIHYWHAGSSLHYTLISPQGEVSQHILGPSILDGNEQLQLTVAGGYWKASRLIQGEYGLLSEAVAPGFDYADMTLANMQQMQRDFPQLWDRPVLREKLTRLIR